ncbi:MAG: gamma-glutamyl-gamma-aminobutyrate hydrolase family protein [Planctomycetota bacterium]
MVDVPHPVIGLTVELLDAPWYEGKRRFQLFTDYLPCLRAAGAIPILLPSDAPVAEVAGLLERVDGVLMTGGDDVDLRPFGGPAPTVECKPVPLEQQSMNLEIVRVALERKMPLFGVCFGMQMMGVLDEAPFRQHLENAAEHTKGIEHQVVAAAGSRLAELVGTDAFDVPSFHHQALIDTGNQLQASAYADDGTLEAVELPEFPFALGVQWHPERAPESQATRALFDGFVTAAREYRSES